MRVDSVGWVCLLLQDSFSNIPVNTNRHTLPCQHGVDFYSCSHTFAFFLLLFLSSPFTQSLICVWFFPCYIMLSSFRSLLTYNWKHFFVVFCSSPVSTLCVSVTFLWKQLYNATAPEQGKKRTKAFLDKGLFTRDAIHLTISLALHLPPLPLPLDFLRSSANLS